MEWAALIAWLITAGGGFVLLSIWLMQGGMQQAQRRNRIRPPLILSHFLLATGGLVVWIIFPITDNDALAWIARRSSRSSQGSASRCSRSGFGVARQGPGRDRNRNARRSCGTALPGRGRGGAWTACCHDCCARAAHRAGRRQLLKDARVGKHTSGRTQTEVISRSCSWPDRERRARDGSRRNQDTSKADQCRSQRAPALYRRVPRLHRKLHELRRRRSRGGRRARDGAVHSPLPRLRRRLRHYRPDRDPSDRAGSSRHAGNGRGLRGGLPRLW